MKIFVYGTLLRGESNHRLLEHSTFVREARTGPGFQMHSLGGFPGATYVTLGFARVVGEVYDVDIATLARIDGLEGHPNFYERKLVTLDGGERAWIYLLPYKRVLRCDVIHSGSWRKHRAEEEKRSWLSR